VVARNCTGYALIEFRTRVVSFVLRCAFGLASTFVSTSDSWGLALGNALGLPPPSDATPRLHIESPQGCTPAHYQISGAWVYAFLRRNVLIKSKEIAWIIVRFDSDQACPPFAVGLRNPIIFISAHEVDVHPRSH
jgi:hypothetical protein